MDKPLHWRGQVLPEEWRAWCLKICAPETAEKFKNKYIGVRLRDDEDDSGDEGGAAAGEDYLGEIIGIDFIPKREGAFPRGYYLLTALVTSDGKLDDENTRVYTISEATHKEMILAADNTDFKFSWLAA